MAQGQCPRWIAAREVRRKTSNEHQSDITSKIVRLLVLKAEEYLNNKHLEKRLRDEEGRNTRQKLEGSGLRDFSTSKYGHHSQEDKQDVTP